MRICTNLIFSCASVGRKKKTDQKIQNISEVRAEILIAIYLYMFPLSLSLSLYSLRFKRVYK